MPENSRWDLIRGLKVNAGYEYRHRIVRTWHLGSAHRLRFTSQHRVFECPLLSGALGGAVG